MNEIFGMDLSLFIAVVTVITTAISSLITIIVTKLFENYQNSKKHKRVVVEKILDSKLEVCKKAISYYGTYLNYLYSSIYTFKNLESPEYAKLQGELVKFSEDLSRKIQLDNNNAHHQILLFYDLHNSEDEKLGEKIANSNKEYLEYISNVQNIDFEIEKKLRNELIKTIEESISYFKLKIETVRNDLTSML